MSFIEADERTRVARIRELNDNLRLTFGGGKIVMTAAFAALGHEIKAVALLEMRLLSNFDEDNDPYSEHDLGLLEIGHYTFRWQIAYYDKTMEFGSEDPSDPEKTTRVLTIGLSSCF